MVPFLLTSLNLTNLTVDESESDRNSAIQVPLHNHGIITNMESQTVKSMTLAEDLSREGGLEDEVTEAAFVICWPSEQPMPIR